jgi:predicted nucleic acid-binding protein
MYVDTSVVAKLYLNEPDSEASEAVAMGNPLVSSRLLHCEFRSALHGKASRGVIGIRTLAEVWQAFETDVAEGRLRLVSLDDDVARDASDLLAEIHSRVPLRTLDALHLATYMGIEAGPLFTRDQRMRQAAGILGLPLAG